MLTFLLKGLITTKFFFKTPNTLHNKSNGTLPIRLKNTISQDNILRKIKCVK